MEISEYKNIFENEKRHFFYVSTHGLVLNLIKKYVKKSRPQILDAGCGTGGLAKGLESVGKVTGVDYSAEALKFAQRRGLSLKKGSVEALPFKDGSFDVVTSVDVIYHKWVKNDGTALKEMKRVLRKGGLLVLRVPANKFLYSAHDRQVMTARRYSKRELQRKIEETGFKIKQISYVHSPIFLLSLANVLVERFTGKKGNSAIGKVPSLLNKLLTLILNFEGELIVKGIPIPFGQGLVCVAEELTYKMTTDK